MLKFKNWIRIKRKKKDERHNSQVSGEIGHINQQRQVAGLDPQEPTQAVHVFPSP
jgi:hypothetical protein